MATTARNPAARRGRVYIDWARNAHGQLLVVRSASGRCPARRCRCRWCGTKSSPGSTRDSSISANALDRVTAWPGDPCLRSWPSGRISQRRSRGSSRSHSPSARVPQRPKSAADPPLRLTTARRRRTSPEPETLDRISVTPAEPRIPVFFSRARGEVRHRKLREPRYQPATESTSFSAAQRGCSARTSTFSGMSSPSVVPQIS